MDCQEYKEMISAHVDGVLSRGEQTAVESHLRQCSRCTQTFVWETEIKQSLKQKLSAIPIRTNLRERLLDQLGETSKGRVFGGWSFMSHGLAAAFALLLIVTVPYLVWQDKAQEEIFTDAIAQYQRVRQGTVYTPQAASPLTPGAQLLDLSPWGYDLLAKQTQQFKGQEGRVFIYRGRAKEYLLAQEFDAGDYSLPHNATTMRVSGQDFVSYSKGNVNLIGWKEKGLICILTSDLPKDTLLRLAREIALGS